MKLAGAEVAAVKTEIRRQHGYDSYYLGWHQNLGSCAEVPVVHEFALDDSASTAYVWFVRTEVCIVLKGPEVTSPSAAALSWAAGRAGAE